MAEGAMTAFLTNIGTFFTQSLTWLGEALEVVINSPALTILVLAMPIVGFSVGLLSRLIRL
jgi:hypothetical protein